MTTKPTKKIKTNPWILSTIVLSIVVILLGIVIYGNPGQVTSVKAGESFVEFINIQGQSKISLTDTEDFGSGLYKVIVETNGNQVPVYVTKDGKYFLQGVTPITGAVTKTPSSPSQPSQPSQEIPKQEKPVAELFVMTHCPYGTQAEKGFISVMETLKDLADVKIRFVHYYMHTNQQEEVETPRQVCIREEQENKYLDYLECFLSSTSGSTSEAKTCESQVGLNSKALEECISSGRADKYYEEDSKLSQQYGVRGSPTLIINGEQAQFGRDSQSYFEGICLGFNDMPELCTTETLSTASPSPGFGYSGAGSATQAQC